MSAQTPVTAPDLRVVLNGGSPVMESATIPFRWFFSATAIEAQPTDLLMIDQSERDIGNPFRGQRTLVEISRGSAFIQFSSPGKHRFTFIAMKEYGAQEHYGNFKDTLLKRETAKMYHCAVDIDDIEAGDPLWFRENHASFVAMSFVDIDVPVEFFAAAPKSKTAQAIWSWTNRWFETGPRDECVYRQRMIWAFTLQPIAFILGHMAKYIAVLVCTIYLPIARVLTFYFGYRPEFLFAGIGDVWSWKWEPKEVNWALRQHRSYRVWRERDYSGSPRDRHVDMPITGFELTVVLVSLLLGYVMVTSMWELIVYSNWRMLILASVFALVCVIFMFVFIAKTEFIIRTDWWNSMTRNIEERNRLREERLAAEKPLLYFEWLKRHADLAHAPQRVDIKELPEAFTGKGRQRVYVRFWAVKRKVCKPFAR